MKTQNNDYYRGKKDFEKNRQPEPGHARMSRATLSYMAGYHDARMERSKSK